jgi:hypothetical protein
VRRRRGCRIDRCPLGALTLLTGCDLGDHGSVQRVLAKFSVWNDKMQTALFSQQRLAPTFPEAMPMMAFRPCGYGWFSGI